MSSDISDYQYTSGSTSRDDINKILSALNQIRPKIQKDASKAFIAYSPHIRIRTFGFEQIGLAVQKNHERDKETGQTIRYLPTTFYSYPLTHTLTGTLDLSPTGHKWGGKATFDGTQYITTDDNDWMDFGTGAFGFMYWFKGTGTGTYGILCKKDIGATTNAGLDIYHTSGTDINLRIADGTNTVISTKTSATLNNGSWHAICVNLASAGNIEIFVDGASLGTTSRGSVANTNNTRSCYLGARDNGGTPSNKLVGSLSHVYWEKEIFSSTEVTNYYSHRQIETNNDVTSWEFRGTSDATPNTRSGMAYSS